MIGIEVYDEMNNQTYILLNPGDYTFIAGQANSIFLLAEDKSIADKIQEIFND